MPGFDVASPVGRVACTAERWAEILLKHPILAGREQAIEATIAEPAEIRRSKHDDRVALCYRPDGQRWLCAVIRPDSGILVTAYPTDKVKEGDVLWMRSA